MKSHIFRSSLCAGLLLSIPQLAGANEAAVPVWKIPTPATVTHPGAEAAPASSPATFADEAGFQKRARLIVEALATNELGQWRRGYFTGGDPGKYLPGAAMAKLILNSNDEESRRYLNDDRSYKEQYHFASVNWARLLPIFGAAITPETHQKLSDAAFRADAYLKPGGTENHKTMWWTSASVLPHFLSKGVAHRNKEASLAEAKKQLRDYVKGLYAAGQGEWDSSTYLMFDVNGILNIYDFSPDAETRLLAKAALDWFMTGYALKYRDGVYTSPNQRGFASAPLQSIADRTGWLWWNSHYTPSPDVLRGALYTLAPITSGWRPNAVITNIATKNLPQLPFEARNTKPNYWHGQGLTPQPGAYHESVYNARHYTMGSLWNGFGGQITRFQLVAESANGGVVFTGGHPRKSDHTTKRLDEITYADGGGRYDQSAQARGAYILMSRVPDEEALDYVFFSIPEGATKPVKKGDWWLMRVDKTFVALRALGADAVLGETDLNQKQRDENAKAIAGGGEPKHKPDAILRFPGRRTGFILQTAAADDARFILRHEAAFKPVNPTVPVPTVEQLFEEFGQMLQQQDLDVSKFATDMDVTYRAFDDANLNGAMLRMKYEEGRDRAAAWINGEAVPFDNEAIYNSRYVQQKNSVLSVNDGRSGFIVDFSGDLPVYKSWDAKGAQ